MSAFKLKIIAITAMTCNHIAHAFDGYLPVYLHALLYVAGGLTFPIMACLMIEGYQKTSSIKKYMLRLLVFGVLAVFPFILVFKVPMLNVLFTFLFGLICLYLRDRMKSRAMFGLCFTGIVCFTVFCDWPFVGVIMIMMYGTLKTPNLRLFLTASMPLLILVPLQILVSGWSTALLPDIGFSLVVFGSIPLLMAYNGERGYSPRSLRYLFYIYYPAHLLVIGAAAWLI